MTTENHNPESKTVEMPEPTVWPLVFAVALALLAFGLITNVVFLLLGGVMAVTSAVVWIGQNRPGKGEFHEEITGPAPQSIEARPGTVESMRPGVAGYRMRMPEKIHPYTAGLKGGIAGGIAMMVPALIYCLVSGNPLWYPINLLSATVVPDLTLEQLKTLHVGLLLLGIVIHLTMSVGLGLINGVLLPMLPGNALYWSGLAAPALWSASMYAFMGVVNPELSQHVDWWSFIIAQFVYGVVVGIVVTRTEKVYVEGAQAEPAPGEGNP